MNSRKFLALILALFSIMIVIFVSRMQISSEVMVKWDDIYISDKDYTTLSASNNLSQTPLSIKLYFNDELLIYDSKENTFYYSLVDNDNSAFTPIVEAADPDMTVFAYGDKITAESIAANSHIKLILVKGNDVSISDLVCTTNPVMNISINQDIIDSNCFDETFDIIDDVPSSIYFFDNRDNFDGRSRAINCDAKIHRRGQTNALNPQKSYKLTLLKDKNDMDGDRVKENILGLRNDDDWILYAPYKDFEKCRNVLSTNLWYEGCATNNEWNAKNGTQFKFLELFINGRYHGIYAICYPIDSKQVKLKGDETLYKKMDWTQSERYTEATETLDGYVIKDGDASWPELQILYMNMFYSIDTNAIRQTSDLGNSIDFWLFYKLTQAIDNVAAGSAKNMYVTVKNSDNGIVGKKLLFTPWDMDQTWYYVGEGTVGLYSAPQYDLPMEFGTVDCLQLRNDPDINSQIKARYAELRASAWSNETVMDALDSYEASVFGSGAFDRTKSRWPEGMYMDSSIGMSDFKEYVLKRIECMDEYIKALD